MQTEKPGVDKIMIIISIVLVGFVILLLRLWQLQVLQGSDFREISEKNRLRIIGVPAPRGIIYDRNGIPLVKDTPFFTASVLSEEFDRRNIPALAGLLKISEDEILGKLDKERSNTSKPVRLKERLPFDEVGFIEARRSDFPGLIIEVDVSRKYIYDNAGAHAIGYLGKLTPAQSTSPDYKDVPPQAFIGQWGVEKLYDRTLRGLAGQRVFEVDALGREIRLLHEKPPVKGNDLSLSLDIALQTEVEKAFEGKKGAFVALKPSTGEILGLVSSPAFDPNKFAEGITYDDWMAISNDRDFPLLNRAIQSQYPPGSIFKIITAIAALERGVMDTSTKVECRGSISFGKWRFGCWKKYGHGAVSIHRALVESCDVFFYEAGKRLGIDSIYDYASRFGLGKKTDIPLGREKAGLIPNSRWKMEAKRAKWFLGETFINSIGQGYVSITPIQAAVMISASTNGGVIYRPTLLKNSEPVQVRTAGVRPETLEIIKSALLGVVNEPRGTGRSSKSALVKIGGKTGTAQVVGIKKDSKDLPEKFRDHAWFVAFAPAEDPEIALVVFVEHGGHGGSGAAPIAKEAIEAYLVPEEKKRELFDVQN